MSTFSTGKVKKEGKTKREKPPKNPKARVWSPQQLAVFKACEKTKGNLTVEALAGTGKTTTIVEALNYLPAPVLLCAFNKRIADELRQKAPPSTHVYTLHALGFRLLKRLNANLEVDDKKGLRSALSALQLLGGPLSKNYQWAVHFCASTAKECDPYILLNKTGDNIGQRIAKLGLTFGHLDGISPRHHTIIGEAAAVSMNTALEMADGAIDYSDMLFIPLNKGLTRGEYQVVIVDEAQDMNRAQLELAQRIMHKEGRIIVVGDRHQAIYGFRGADSGSMDRLTKKFDSRILPLNVTYRCPKLVVKAAQAFVPEFTAADSAPEGIETFGSTGSMMRDAQPGDFILSRVNAPLLSNCLELIKMGKRAKVEGRDIGRTLTSLIYKLTRGPCGITEFLSALNEWEREAVGKAAAMDDDERCELVRDQASALRILSQESATTNALIHTIENLFADAADKGDCIVLSTVHKAKGLEADRVFILADTFKGTWGVQPPSEEANLKYVAVTRAKKELVWVNRSDAPRAKAPPPSGVDAPSQSPASSCSTSPADSSGSAK